MDVKETPTELYLERLSELNRHITNVQESAYLLTERLVKRGQDRDRVLAHDLITNVQQHDHSKFNGIEWLYLHDDVRDSGVTEADKKLNQNRFKMAWYQHVTTNEHHPEYWSGINNMPEVYIAEMVCDWKARSNEFGSDLREWIKTSATKRFGFKTAGKTYKKIKEFVDLLLDSECIILFIISICIGFKS